MPSTQRWKTVLNACLSSILGPAIIRENHPYQCGGVEVFGDYAQTICIVHVLWFGPCVSTPLTIAT